MTDSEMNLAVAIAKESNNTAILAEQIKYLKEQQEEYNEKKREVLELMKLPENKGNKILEDELIHLNRELTGLYSSIDSVTQDWIKTSIEGDANVIKSRDAVVKKEEEITRNLIDKQLQSRYDAEKNKEELAELKAEAVRAEAAAIQAILDDKSISKSDVQIKALKDSLHALTEQLMGLEVKSRSAMTYMRELAKTVGNAFIDNIADGIANTVSGTKDFRDSFKQMAQSIIADIMRIIAKLLLLKALWATIGKTESGANFLGNVLGLAKVGSIFGGGGGGGGGAPSASMNRAPSFQISPEMVPAFAKSFRAPAYNMPFTQPQPSQTIININATDAQSFAKMLATKPAQEMITGAVTTKFSHNAPIRRTLNRGR